MQNPKNITFIIYAFNEAHRIEYPIKCYLPYGEVLIVDNFSTDGTPELAKELGARVLQYNNSPNMGIPECKEEWDVVRPHIHTEWVFWGFADEMVPQPCLELYAEIAKKNGYKIVVQKHKTMLYQPEMEFLPANAVIKLFKIGALELMPFGEFIHGIGRYAPHVKPADIFFLPPIDEYSVYHFSVYTTEKLIGTHNKYSTIHAKLIPEGHMGIKIFLQPLIAFLTIFIVQGAFKRGILGFIVAVEYSYYIFQVLAKAYENQNSITAPGIEDNFKKRKKTLLHESPKSSLLTKGLAAIKISIFSKIYLYKHLRKNIKQQSK